MGAAPVSFSAPLLGADQGSACGRFAWHCTLEGRMLSPLASGIYVGMGAAAALGLAGAGPALGVAAGGCAYAGLWPGSQLFGDALIAPSRPIELALPFDDGPNPAWTPRLLYILATHQVRATFFLVGRWIGKACG